MGWYDWARSRGFSGTPEQLMDIMVGNIERLLDHDQLRNRDAEAQHPISAIEGLERELNELRRMQGGDTVSDGWRTVELYPVLWHTESWHKITASEGHDEYFAMPDEIDIGVGMWEIELYVNGLYGSGISGGTEVFAAALIDRQIGMEDTSAYCEPFSVKVTQTTGAGRMTVRHHAIANASRYNTERDGYVSGAMTHDQECFGTAEAGSMPVNTVAMRINRLGVDVHTGGIYLRYRRIM